MKLLCTSFLLVIGLFSSFGHPNPFMQQSGIEFRNEKIEINYPDGINFRIEICGRPTPSDVVFNYTTSQDATQYWGWNREIWSVDEGQTSDDCDMRKFHLETKELGIPPFSPIKYFWSITEGTDTLGRSPTYTYYHKDGRYTWKSLKDEQLAVWWHDRPDSFGEDVMYIASRAYQDQAKFYSSSLESPITVVIVNTSEEFFAWQAEEDYAAGLAFYDRFLTIQLVEDSTGYYDWISNVLPHEISHIYFNHLVKRYSGASYWLDEGLATYNEFADHSYERNILKPVYERGEILSLEDLEYDFGEDDDKIDLAYAESYYAVLYMDEFYGKEAIATLLYEYSQGTGATAAFEKSFGKNPGEFEQDFVVWLGERLRTPAPHTEIPQPPQNNITVQDTARNISTALPYPEIFLVGVFGFILASILLKPKAKLFKRKTTRNQS